MKSFSKLVLLILTWLSPEWKPENHQQEFYIKYDINWHLYYLLSYQQDWANYIKNHARTVFKNIAPDSDTIDE